MIKTGGFRTISGRLLKGIADYLPVINVRNTDRYVKTGRLEDIVEKHNYSSIIISLIPIFNQYKQTI